MKTILKRIAISFAISSFAGLIVHLLIDLGVNYFDNIAGFVSVPTEFAAHFATPTIAAYFNILVYGVIGATFSGMTFVFELDRLGFLLQYIIFFCATSIVLTFITACLWKLQTTPIALIFTIIGYGISFVIMGLVQYRLVKQDIKDINEMIS